MSVRATGSSVGQLSRQRYAQSVDCEVQQWIADRTCEWHHIRVSNRRSMAASNGHTGNSSVTAPMSFAKTTAPLCLVTIAIVATLDWLDWFYHRRLLEPIGDVPPAEYEARYYEQAAVA